MKSFSFTHRNNKLQKLKTQVFDLVIIGGGITGAGAARDAALRGLKVALIEAQDFAEGTSSRSSKLIHGGIRYLENYEFGLVFEALNERTKLFQMAPHLVHPLRFVLPVYKDDRVGMFKLGLGMWAYDALALFDMPELHQRLSLNNTLQKVGGLRAQGLSGSYIYSDAYMDDDRLVVETLRSATQEGATCVSYVQATEAEFKDSKMTSVVAMDKVSNEKFEIQGRHFISTVGPWTDRLGKIFLPSWKPILRPSKGIHLTFERQRWPIEDAVVMSTRTDKRIIFAIPRKDMVIVGTTDTDYPGDPSQVSVLPEDVEYLFKIVHQYFPGLNLKPSDVVSSYAGVRPLVADDAGSESATSREHTIFSVPQNVTFVAGGKYTTYRYMASQVIQQALQHLPQEVRNRTKRVNTAMALNPLVSEENYLRAFQYIEHWSKDFAIPVSVVQQLVERHGMETESILLEGIRRRIKSLWGLEAIHAIHNTHCGHLTDFFFRRTPLVLSRRDHGRPLAESVALLFQMELGWSEEQREAELVELEKLLAHEFRWQKSFNSSLAPEL